MKNRLYLLSLIILLLVFSACSKAQDPVQIVADETILKTEESQKPSLSVGLMSAVDSAPFYLAQQKGYYQEEGVQVDLILFTNGQNRQTALQTGKVDGAMTDLVALITQSASDFPLVGTLSTDGVFPLLANKVLTGIDTISVGTMEISVTNYLLEQYLAKDHTLKKVFINEIPARLEAVVAHQLDAGIFPEPFASIGEQRGLHKIIFEGIPAESLNIIAFSKSAIEEKFEAIAGFHRAYARAVKDLQDSPEIARDVLLGVIPNLPPTIRDTMYIPHFHLPRLPSDEFTRQIIDWTANVTKNSYSLEPNNLYDYRFVQEN